MKLFANCWVVKGATRSIIYDLQRQKYHFIPNSMADMLLQHDGENLDVIKAAYNHQYDNTIDEYVEFLMEKEYAFYTNHPECYPEMLLDWDEPSHITNAIICENESNHTYTTIFQQLDNLNCKALQWRFFKLNSFVQLENYITMTDDSRLQHIEIIMPWVGELKIDKYKKLVHNHRRIWNIRIFNAPYSRIDFIDQQKQHPLAFTTENITDNSFCGDIFPNNFRVNIKMFTEALQYNTCLNRKVAISVNGEIKNCPSMPKSFGNVNKHKIKEIVQKHDFKSLWSLKKDIIEVCKDCEFRYMCLDCRAYTKNKKENMQPSKCNYNPYIAKWKGQKGYVTINNIEK